MLSGRVRILNFDDSVAGQKNLVTRFNPTIVDLKTLGPSCRTWIDKEDAVKVTRSLDLALKDSITFLGSGDFHQISSLLIGQFPEPLSLIVFDHHPDWDIMPPHLGCGSWVRETLKADNVEKAILVGVSSGDIGAGSIQTASLDLLKDDRIEIYPYSHRPTNVFFRDVPGNISIETRRGLFYNRICWQELKNKNLKEFFLHVIKRLPTKRVYVSIDKDCLKAEYSLTNWEAGYLELGELLALLKVIRDNLDVVGVDILGDYSPPKTEGLVKTLCSRADRPSDYSAKGKARHLIDSVNEDTNTKILEMLRI